MPEMHDAVPAAMHAAFRVVREGYGNQNKLELLRREFPILRMYWFRLEEPSEQNAEALFRRLLYTTEGKVASKTDGLIHVSTNNRMTCCDKWQFDVLEAPAATFKNIARATCPSCKDPGNMQAQMSAERWSRHAKERRKELKAKAAEIARELRQLKKYE